MQCKFCGGWLGKPTTPTLAAPIENICPSCREHLKTRRSNRWTIVLTFVCAILFLAVALWSEWKRTEPWPAERREEREPRNVPPEVEPLELDPSPAGDDGAPPELLPDGKRRPPIPAAMSTDL